MQTSNGTLDDADSSVQQIREHGNHMYNFTVELLPVFYTLFVLPSKPRRIKMQQELRDPRGYSGNPLRI